METRRRFRLNLAVSLVAALVLAVPGAAHLSQYTYAQGVNGAGGTYPGSSAFNHRDYNQVWHQAGKLWIVYYLLSNNDFAGLAGNTDNPTRWGGEIGYGSPKCRNDDDNSGVTWTCQSTGG